MGDVAHRRSPPPGGFLAVPRERLDSQHPHHPRTSGESACRAFAWIDLVGMAPFQDGENRRTGEVRVSERFLMERWNWPKSTVHRFLDGLVKTGEIEREQGVGRQPGVIRIVGYRSRFLGEPRTVPHAGPRPEPQREPRKPNPNNDFDADADHIADRNSDHAPNHERTKVEQEQGVTRATTTRGGKAEVAETAEGRALLRFLQRIGQRWPLPDQAPDAWARSFDLPAPVFVEEADNAAERLLVKQHNGESLSDPLRYLRNSLDRVEPGRDGSGPSASRGPAAPRRDPVMLTPSELEDGGY